MDYEIVLLNGMGQTKGWMSYVIKYMWGLERGTNELVCRKEIIFSMESKHGYQMVRKEREIRRLG